MSFYDNYKRRSATSWRTRVQERYCRKLFDRYGLALTGKDFLEVGPGTGMIARLVRERGGNYRAIEGNQELAEGLQNQGFEIAVGYCPPLPFAEGSADFIFCSHVIEHMSGPEMVYEFFRECQRVLRPGGRLMIVAPDAYRMKEYFWDCDYTHIFPVTKRRVTQLLLDAGLQGARVDEVTEPVGPLLRPWVNLFTRLYPYKLLETILPGRALKTFAYKIRSTFAECICATAVKA